MLSQIRTGVSAWSRSIVRVRITAITEFKTKQRLQPFLDMRDRGDLAKLVNGYLLVCHIGTRLEQLRARLGSP